jgi:DnaJ-class molecular chaperone
MADFTANKEELSKLSSTIGIDLQALKSKYAQEKSPADIVSKLFGLEDNAAQVSVEEETKKKKTAQETNAKLDQYKVCIMCGGTGIEKYEYNHIRMERNCTECDGDGLQQGVSTNQEKQLKALSAELGISLEGEGSTEQKEENMSVMMNHDWLSDPTLPQEEVAPELI